MARPRNPNPKIKRTPLQLRIAIVTLRFFNPNMTFLEIAKKLDLEEKTCQRIYALTVQRASSPGNFRDLLACAGEAPRPGRAPDPGSRRSKQLARKAAREAEALAEVSTESTELPIEEPSGEPAEEIAGEPAGGPQMSHQKSLQEIPQKANSRDTGQQTRMRKFRFV